MIKNILRLFLGLTGTFALASCDRDIELLAETAPVTENTAFLKVVQVAPSFRQLFNIRDSFNVYVGARKINSGWLSFNSYLPGQSIQYSAVPSGNQAIRLTVGSPTNPDSATILTLDRNLASGKYYSLVITDSIKSNRDSSRIFVQDVFERPVNINFSLRFIHAGVNDTAGRRIDLYSSRRNAIMAANIAPGTISNFSVYSYTGITDTLIVRRTGTGFELARLNGVTFGAQRIYSLVYKGDMNVTGTATKARSLSVYTHE